MRWIAMILGVVGVSVWLAQAPPKSDGPLRNAQAPIAAWRSLPSGVLGSAGSFDPSAVGRSVPLALHGAMGQNIRLALDANGGALRSVVIPPGAPWSFNAAIGDPRGLPLLVVGGVIGGGWCDLASRYVQAVRPLAPPDAIRFVNHVQSTGVRMAHVADADAVAIWNIDGQPGTFGGRLDLVITNPHPFPLHLTVIPGPSPDTIVVEARLMR